MRIPIFRWHLLVLLLAFPLTAAAQNMPRQTCPEELTSRIPARSATAPNAKQFFEQLSDADQRSREAAVLDQFLAGNLPGFLRQLVPVKLTGKLKNKRTVSVIVCVMPDYLSVGSNENFVRMPINFYTATRIGRELGFVLPTRKIVDAIYRQAAFQFRPLPLAPGPEMSSNGYYQQHNALIRTRRREEGIPLGALVAGHKKDVVVTNRLRTKKGRIAIYGWHRRTGRAIQPLSTVHGARYEDYSHGIRLVSQFVLINGKPHSIYALLEDPRFAPVLSYEGVIRNLRGLMGYPPVAANAPELKKPAPDSAAGLR